MKTTHVLAVALLALGLAACHKPKQTRPDAAAVPGSAKNPLSQLKSRQYALISLISAGLPSGSATLSAPEFTLPFGFSAKRITAVRPDESDGELWR